VLQCSARETAIIGGLVGEFLPLHTVEQFAARQSITQGLAGSVFGNGQFPGFSLKGMELAASDALTRSSSITKVDQATEFLQASGYVALRRERDGNSVIDLSNPKLPRGQLVGPNCQYFKFTFNPNTPDVFNVEIVAQGFIAEITRTSDQNLSLNFGENQSLVLSQNEQLSFKKTDKGVVAFIGSIELAKFLDLKFPETSTKRKLLAKEKIQG
jgi:hypothetical protein